MDIADNFEDLGCAEDGQQLSTDSQKTEIVEEEYYLNREGDLAGADPRRVAGQKLRIRLPSLDLAQVESTFEDVDMADSSQPTQQATQPFEDPRRLGKHLSDVSDEDVTDVICLLHPNSPAAFQAVRATMLAGAEHILQNNDLEGLSENDLLLPGFQKGREIALRMSSTVKQPKDGFRFGRNPQLCDVLLTNDIHDKLISNTHFKIFVNNQGSLMLQDLSTNGTIVDDDHLRMRNRKGQEMQKPATRALKNGTIICLVCEPNRSEIKFLVRVPNRGDNEELYEQKLRKYLEKRGKVAQFASMRENAIGNHWNGGSSYNFTGMLGKGAFATVYRVQTKREGNMYAAKELDKRRFIKNGILDLRFDNELKIMKNLKHPNIVDYIESHHHEHWIYIIMEYIPFGELSQELRAREWLPEEEVQQITRQILHALNYLHKRDITHRDIKPDNILIASRDPLVVKLSDFGLSKSVTDQETFLKTFCGTLLYCAPEVYPDYSNYTRGLNPKRRRVGEPGSKTSPYDQSVDMWSFGAVVFHLLCGKAPITGRGDDRGAQMLSNIMTKDVDFEPLRERGVSEEAIDFVAKLLNRNPFSRPKESECLKHAWLRHVPDIFEYKDEEEGAEHVRRALQAVEEIDEDILDAELIQNLGQLTQLPTSSLNSTPNRPSKKPRTDARPSVLPDEISYPILPSDIAGSPPKSTPGGRLFGEITPSVLRSSGIFGDQTSPTTRAMPEIRNRVENISVNDFGSFPDAPSIGSADISGQFLHEPVNLGIPQQHPSGFAPSLLGAEAQIGQLNMTSPDAEVSDPQTPDTTHPITPRTREISPSSSITKSAENEAANSLRGEHPTFSRVIDLNLINDNEAFAAEIAARDASRAEKLREKAQTFQATTGASRRVPSIELARTIDARTGLEVPNERRVRIRSDHSDFVKPPRRFGRLSSVPGSFATASINLEDRMTTWGRGLDCNAPYPDRKDVRIPKFGMKLAFWAAGVEKFVDGGGNWMQYPGIHTILATSATGSIWVNGVKLRKESETGDSALFGKIYTGDIITIYESPNGEEFLKFRVEITFGDSARPRPSDEAGFVIQRESKFHQIQKERESMRQSRGENDEEALARATVVEE